MKISFYVLSESKAQDFLGFICQLSQTALNKSRQSLLILIEDETLLATLDDALWGHDASSFIPHHLLTTNADSVAFISKPVAPVLLGAHLPAEFAGIIINTTARPINDFITATSNAVPTRILEIIKPDASNVQDGRNKYKHYQQLGYELTHFKV
ncbi:DNA polymerase III subunit chi [Psychrobacter sp. CAL346-MNA-CIBAN-0220]|uniref:DNA polymerase III subunit chi n=1 Tax=Psychrobacter sp. CAL346-MNA-CIBAN-0220 TaxID=3140457 RepID=UPI0033342F12